jgi:hypothetical protein
MTISKTSVIGSSNRIKQINTLQKGTEKTIDTGYNSVTVGLVALTDTVVDP